MKTEVDPLENLLVFLQNLEDLRHPNDPLRIIDRERFVAVTILSLLSDPKHPIGGPLMKKVLPVYLERGGKLPLVGQIARRMRETDQFQFTVQYLYDRGLSANEIGNIFGCHLNTIRNTIKHLRDEDIDLSEKMKEIDDETQSKDLQAVRGVFAKGNIKRRKPRVQKLSNPNN